MTNEFPKTIETTKIGKGHYRIEREDGFAIEVKRESKRRWTSDNTFRKTLGEFETDVKNGHDDFVIKKEVAEKAVSKNYKNHRNARTADLHRAYDTMERKDAFKYAIEKLGYTHGGAASWFSDWKKMDIEAKLTKD